MKYTDSIPGRHKREFLVLPSSSIVSCRRMDPYAMNPTREFMIVKAGEMSDKACVCELPFVACQYQGWVQFNLSPGFQETCELAGSWQLGRPFPIHRKYLFSERKRPFYDVSVSVIGKETIQFQESAFSKGSAGRWCVDRLNLFKAVSLLSQKECSR